MTVPTSFYTQQASLLPTGLQSMIQGMQGQPQTAMQPQPGGSMVRQTPWGQTPQAWPPGTQNGLYGQPPQQIPANWNLAAQAAAPIYQPPPPQAAAPAPVQQQPQQPMVRPGIVAPIQTNAVNRLSAQ